MVISTRIWPLGAKRTTCTLGCANSFRGDALRVLTAFLDEQQTPAATFGPLYLLSQAAALKAT